MIMQYFQANDEDTGRKKSAALMVEVMYKESSTDQSNDGHPRHKYYLPYNSEVSRVISKLTTKAISIKSAATN